VLDPDVADAGAIVHGGVELVALRARVIGHVRYVKCPARYVGRCAVRLGDVYLEVARVVREHRAIVRGEIAIQPVLRAWRSSRVHSPR